jgi:Protein of unknown function (DUF4012)
MAPGEGGTLGSVQRTEASGDAEERPKEPPARPRRRRRRLALLVVLFVVLVGAAGAALVAASTLDLRPKLEEGRRALHDGRQALLNGRVGDAETAFRRATDAFDGAAAEASSGWTGFGRLLPVLGRTPDVVAAIAEAGAHAGRAGTTIAAAIDELPHGIDALAPTGGALPLDVIVSLGPALDAARSEIDRASATLYASPDGLLPGPVADARRAAIDRVDAFDTILAPAGTLARGLTAFAGGDDIRRYLFLAQNPAELRGTGGIWGAFAIVEAREGRFSFSPFSPIQSLQDAAPGTVSAPNADYARNYGQYGAPGFWLNINMTPDFPSAARAALATWHATRGDRLDGVMTADPFALQRLLEVTGGVRLTFPPLEVTHENVVPLLTNRAFSLFPDARTRKAVLGEAARVVFDEFLRLPGHALPKLRAIASVLADGHLRIYSDDPAMQRGLAAAGIDGGLRSTDGDLSAVVVNSGAGDKVDYYAKRSITHDVTLLPEGRAMARTLTTIENDAPSTGQPRYVIGPSQGEAGANIPLVAVFCGKDCRLIRADRDGRRIRVQPGSELGFRFYRDYFTIPSGDTGSLSVETARAGAWSGDRLGGSYRLTVLGQTTVRPTTATIRVRAPAGMRFTSWSDGITVSNAGVAIWRGQLEDRLELELSFAAPSLPVRVWRAVTGLF